MVETSDLQEEANDLMYSLAARATRLLGDCSDIFVNEIKSKIIQSSHQYLQVPVKLYYSCHLTSQSALLLIGNGLEWDADLLERSIVEGSFKMIYMLTGTREEQEKKVIEYWGTLPLLASVKRSMRANQVLSFIDDASSVEWQPLRDLVMGKEEIDAIYAKFSKKERQQLEAKWSFNDILRYLAESKSEALRSLLGLAYSYGMGSHQVHKDGDSVAIIDERFQRDSRRYVAVKVAHSCRIISDISHMALCRLHYLAKAIDNSVQCVTQIQNAYSDLFEDIKKLSMPFYDIEYGSGRT